MAAYSLVRLDSKLIALGTVRSKASSLRVNFEHSLKEAVYNFFRGFETTMIVALMTLSKRLITSSFTQQPTLTFRAEHWI